MNSLKSIILFSIIILFINPITNAQNSFQVIVEPPSTGFHRVDAFVSNEEGKLVILLLDFGTTDSGVKIFGIDAANGTALGKKLVFQDNINPPISTKFAYFGNKVISSNGFSISSVNHQHALTVLDMVNGDIWCKKLLGHIPFYRSNSFTQNIDGDILIANSPLPDTSSPFPSLLYPYTDLGILELFMLDQQGNTAWKSGFILRNEVTLEPHAIVVKDIQVSPQGEIFLMGYFWEVYNVKRGGLFIVKLSSTGQPIFWKTIKNTVFGGMVLSADGIFLLDKGIRPGSLYHLDRINPGYSLLVKLDHSLNFIWAKKYFGENFPYADAEINLTQDGHVLMAHSTKGAFPVILTEIDEQGEIVAQKGYPNYTPLLSIMQDGSYLMASWSSGLDSSGNLADLLPVLAKTGADGNIAGCTTFPTCLFASDTTIEMGSFLIEPYPILDLEDLEIQAIPAEIKLHDFCDFPPPPIPDFFVPDTLCLFDTLRPSGTRNHLAQARQWRLTGPGVDSVLNDSLGFVYHLTQPGEYQLSQAVWVLGCRSDYQRSFTVIPPLEAAIENDVICPGESAVATVTTNRPVTSFAWSNGQTTPSLSIQSGGNYAVTVSDGICAASDTAEIILVSKLLGGQPALSLPPDTTVCFTELPFVLMPFSSFSDSFFMQSDFTPAGEFLLTEAGRYRIGTDVSGCLFWKDFNLTIDCQADVYIPNSFSPNGDGINDLFRPFGTDFSLLELAIYDRWGGEVFKSKYPTAAWDGSTATQGVYLYKITYLDLLTGKKAEVMGDVLLIR